MIKLPAAWPKEQAFDFIQLDAGRAYINDRVFPEPVEEIWNESQTAAYLVYEDGSLWFVNNAEDEVWSNVDDFLAEYGLDELSFGDAND